MGFLDEINDIVDEAIVKELSDKPTVANDDTPILARRGFYAVKNITKDGKTYGKTGKFAIPPFPSLTMNVDFRGSTIQGAAVYTGVLYTKPRVYNIAMLQDWHYIKDENGEFQKLVPNTGSAYPGKQRVPKIERFAHLLPETVFNKSKDGNITPGSYVTVPTVIIPLLMKIETTVFDSETGKKTKTSEDRVVIFQQDITDTLIKDLKEKQLIPLTNAEGETATKKDLIKSTVKYILGDLLTAEIGTVIGILRVTKFTSAPTGDNKHPWAVINIPQKVVDNNEELFDLSPVAEISEEDFVSDIETHLLSSGYIAKEDKTSPLRLVNEALWDEIKAAAKVRKDARDAEKAKAAPTEQVVPKQPTAAKPVKVTPEVVEAPAKPVVIKRTPKPAPKPVEEDDELLDEIFSEEA